MSSQDQEDTPGGLEALVSAVITCLDSSQRRTIRHVQASAEETYKTEMLTLLGEIIQPKLEVLIEYDKPAEPEAAPDDDADSEPPAEAEDDDAGAKRPPVTGQDYERVVRELSYDKMTELLKLAYNYEDHGLFKTWRALCLLRLKSLRASLPPCSPTALPSCPSPCACAGPLPVCASSNRGMALALLIRHRWSSAQC